MTPSKSIATKFLVGASLLVLALFSLFSGACRAFSPTGNIDFHAYWYAGEHLRQRRNPYLAHQNAVYVEPPLTNIDSPDLRWTVSYEGKSFTPANTAPLLLLIALLSFFTWENAQLVWLIINLLCALAVPILAISLSRSLESSERRVSGFANPETSQSDAPKEKQSHNNKVVIPSGARNLRGRMTKILRYAQNDIWWCAMLCATIFWSLAATRLTLAVGQTSLVVLVMSLAAVLLAGGAGRDGRGDRFRREAQIIPARLAPTVGATLMLGIALSKYSLALPVLLYFVMRRQWRIVLGSLLVQLLGLLLLCGLTRSSPIETLVAYLDIMRFHVGQDGIHLAAWLPDGLFWQLVAAIVVTVPVVYAVRKRPTPLTLLALLALWTLLVAYHRGYDVVLVVFPMVLVLGRMFRDLQIPKHTSHEFEVKNTMVRRGEMLLAMSVVGCLMVGYSPLVTVGLLILLGWLAFAPSPTPDRVS